jgi:DNA ligase-1
MVSGKKFAFHCTKMLSRNGNLFHPPLDYIQDFPHDLELDGELWISRDNFHEVMSIVRKQDYNPLWSKVKFLVFDAPKLKVPFEERLNILEERFEKNPNKYIQILPYRR